MSKIPGTYTLESNSNLDEFMKALGVGLVSRKLASIASLDIEFTEKDGVYTMSASSILKSFKLSFKIDEEFIEEADDGRTCKTTVTKDGENKLIQTQKDIKGDKGKDVKYTREFTDTHMIVDCECDGVLCRRIYKRI